MLRKKNVSVRNAAPELRLTYFRLFSMSSPHLQSDSFTAIRGHLNPLRPGLLPAYCSLHRATDITYLMAQRSTKCFDRCEMLYIPPQEGGLEGLAHRDVFWGLLLIVCSKCEHLEVANSTRQAFSFLKKKRLSMSLVYLCEWNLCYQSDMMWCLWRKCCCCAFKK